MLLELEYGSVEISQPPRNAEFYIGSLVKSMPSMPHFTKAQTIGLPIAEPQVLVLLA